MSKPKKIKMEVPYFQVPNKIFDLGLDKHELLVYLYLARCSNNRTVAYPSHATISKKTGMSKTTVKTAIKKLEQKDILTKQTRKIYEKRNATNIYIIQHNFTDPPQRRDSEGGGAPHDPGWGSTQPGVGQHTTGEKELPNKEQENKDPEDSIKKLKDRYDDGELKIVDGYFDLIRYTRKNAKIAKATINNELKYFDNFDKKIILASLYTYISRPDLHSKGEPYVRGIIRQMTAAEAEKVLNQTQKMNQETKHKGREETKELIPNSWEA